MHEHRQAVAFLNFFLIRRKVSEGFGVAGARKEVSQPSQVPRHRPLIPSLESDRELRGISVTVATIKEEREP